MSNRFKIQEKHSGKTRNILAPLWFLLPALILVCIFIYYPVIRTAGLSFQNFKLFAQDEIYYAGFQNFSVIFHDIHFKRIIANSVIWVVVSLFFQFTIGFVLALYLNTKFKFSVFIRR